MLKKFPLYSTLILLLALPSTSFAKPRPVPQPFTCEELGWLADELQSPDADIRRDAISEIKFRAAYAAPLSPYLAALLGDTTYPTPLPAPTTVSISGGSGDGARFNIGVSARQALVAIGYETIPALTEVVKHGALPAKQDAINALGQIHDYEVAAPLLIALDDEDPEIRERAKQALISPWIRYEDYARISGSKNFEIKPLLEALKSPKAFNREVIMIVLGQTYTSDSEELPLRSLAVLDGLKDPAPEVRKEARKNLVYATSRRWPKAKRLLEPIIEAIKDSDPEIRRAALDSAVAYGDMRAERPLLVDLDSTEKKIRWSAISNLEKLKSRAAVQPLIDMMLHLNAKEDGDIRTSIASALATIGDQRAVEPIFKVINDPDGRQNYNVKMAFEQLTGQPLEQHPLWKASLTNKSD